LLDRHLGDVHERTHTRVVDEDVEPAERADGFRDGLFCIARIADVSLELDQIRRGRSSTGAARPAAASA
jgi:hypothetical protein